MAIGFGIGLISLVIYGFIGAAVARESQMAAWAVWGIVTSVVLMAMFGGAEASFLASNTLAFLACVLMVLPGMVGWAMGSIYTAFSGGHRVVVAPPRPVVQPAMRPAGNRPRNARPRGAGPRNHRNLSSDSDFDMAEPSHVTGFGGG